VLRYDKRTNVHGAKVKGLKDAFTIKEEVLDDALAAVVLLRGTGKVDRTRVFVLGHSLGAICAPKLGVLDSNIAGLIAMAGTTRPMEDVVADQLTYILSLGGMTEEQKRQTEQIRQDALDVKHRGQSTEKGTPSKGLLGMSEVYLKSLRDCDPTILMGQIKQPILILQGERDYQATMEDFAGWKRAATGPSKVTLKSYPKLNHLFMEGVGRSKPDEYTNTGHVAREVVEDIAGWVKNQN
jgi:dienelactone hydrolase